MTDQTKKVEEFQTDVNQITSDLAEAKKQQDETLKKAKAEEALLKTETLETTIESAKEQANTKLKELEGKTDATSKAEITKLESEIKKYEEMLVALDSSKTELTTLKSGVSTETKEETKEETTEKTKEEKTGEKKNWFKRQIDGFSDKAEDNHGRKNAGRIALGIGAGVLVWKGLKALFGGNKEKKAKTAWSEKTFLQKVRSVTKVVAVGGGLYYVIHGLSTGKWSLNDFFDRKKKPGYESNDPESFDDLYEDHSKEEKEQYDSLGAAVNEFFAAVYGSVAGESGSDMLGEQNGEDKFEKHTGTMPCALDESSSDVGDILDGTSEFSKKLDDFGAKVSKDIGKQINPLDRFSGSGASAEELAKLDKETVRKYQAYRKTLKVQVFLHQKEKVLVRRLIAEKLGITDYATASEELKKTYDEKIDAAMKDDDTMEAINTKMENIYYNQKLTGVMAVLKKYNISNDEMVEDTKKAIKEVDQDKNDLIGDTLDKATASTDINADATLKGDVSDMCTEFDTKINDEDNQMVDFDNFFIGLGDARLNMEAGDKQKMLKEIGYTDKIAAYSTKVLAIKTKIANGTATKADMAELKQTIDDYYIFKKDIVLGVSFVHEADDKSTGLERTLMYIGGKLIAVLERAWDKGGIVGVTIAAFVMRQAGKAIVKGGSKLTLTAGKNRIRGLGKDPGRLLPGRRLYRFIKGNNRPAKTLRMQAYHGSNGYKLFDRKWKNGNMTISEAQEIIDYHGAKRKTELGVQNLTVDNMLKEGGYIRPDTDSPMTRKLISEYFDTSKSFRKALKSGNRTKVLNNLAKYDTKLKALDVAGETKKAKFMEDVFGYMKCKNGDELAGLVNNIDKIDLSAVEEGRGLEELAKKVGRKVKSTTTLDQLNVFIKESTPKIVQSTVVTPSVSSTVTAADEVVENIPSGSTVEASADLIKNRDEVYKAVDTELTDLNSKIKGYDIDVNSSITGKYYKNQLEGLETFRDQTKLFNDQELTAFKKLKDLDFKASHISELFALGELNSSVKTALKQGNDVDGLMKVLIQQDDAIIKAGGNVSQELVRGLDNIKVAKQTVKYGDEMVDVGEVMFKLLSKVF